MRLKAKRYSELEAARFSKINCLAFEVK